MHSPSPRALMMRDAISDDIVCVYVVFFKKGATQKEKLVWTQTSAKSNLL